MPDQTRLTLDDISGDTLTVPQFAAVMGISRRAAYEILERGEVPFLRFGGRRFRVSKKVAQRLLEVGSLDALQEV